MDAWQKLEIIGKLIAAIVIPLVLGVVGNQFASATKERDTQARFVEIATTILSKEPGANPSEETKNLRRWAVGIIQKYSGVPMEQETVNALVQKSALPTPAAFASTSESSGPWAVVFGGDATLDAARHEVSVTARKMNIGASQIFLRNGAYRSVRVLEDRAAAEDALGKAQSVRSDSYLVNLSKWCPSRFEREGFTECNAP